MRRSLQLTRVAIVYVLFLTSCTSFPRSGPDHHLIESSATDGIPSENQSPPSSYALVDLTPAILDLLPPPSNGSIFKTFGDGDKGAPAIKVVEGDQLQITVFESSSGGLFIPREASVRPGNFVTFPPEIVERSGTIAVPYAGRVQALDRTLLQIQKDIETRLAPRAIQPQVIVSFVDRVSQAAVTGDVTAANKFTVNLGGDRVLDMIAKAGGLRFEGWETYVTLQRKGKESTVYFLRLVDTPRENIFVAPRDIIYAYRKQRFYLAFGSTGQQGRFEFDAENVYLADAIGKASGLIDTRADPAQVFIYRSEERQVLERAGATLASFTPDREFIPTIYHLNLREPSSFFLTQKFAMRDRDIVYISNADTVEVTKFLQLLNLASFNAVNITESGNAARTLLR
jgi:polysaccharide export outer membrane protein